MTQVTTNNVTIAKRCYDLFARGEIETLVNDHFAPNITWTEPETLPEGGVHTGPQAVVDNVFSTFQETWGEDAAVTAKEFFADGDVVFVLGSFAGTSPTGTTYDIPFCHVLRFNDNRIATFQNYTDTALSLKVLN